MSVCAVQSQDSLQSFKYFCRIATESEKYISRCIALAKKGLGHVSPNPLVGCVIVHNGRIVAESYHKLYGGPHAEVNAINALEEHEILRQSTVYVNLEPCAHYGKTPPCANLLIEKKVARVVIGMTDPYPEVASKGIAMLKDAGIEVEVGVLEKDCQHLNRRFIINQSEQRPYIILKWAESADGFVGNGQRTQISGQEAMTLLHQWRSEEDAFMVGTNTLLTDNPKLNVRHVKGRNPIRVAIDMSLKSEGLELEFNKPGQRTILLNGKKDLMNGDLEYHKINDNSVQSIIRKLHELRIGSVVIEGGPELLNSFIEQGLYDEIRVFKSKTKTLGQGIPAPDMQLYPKSEIELGEDILIIF